MKVTYNDKFVCKKTIVHWNGDIKYTCGKKYEVSGISDITIGLTSDIYKVADGFWISEVEQTNETNYKKLSDYFITLKEERKLKLLKIEKNNESR